MWSSGISGEFLLTSLIVSALPGTGVLFTVSSAISGGWRRGLFASLGCTLGIVPHIAAAMLGLSGVMQVGATVFEVIRYLGAAYLIYIGATMLMSRGDLLVETDRRSTSIGAVMRRGVVLNLLNPKLTLFFFAFLPQFLDRQPRLVDPHLLVLAAVFMLTTFVVFVIYAWVSALLRERLLSARRTRVWFQRTLGAMLVGFGAKLAVSKR